MDLELSFDPDDAQRLLRLPLLASATRGRARVRRIVWHDSADAALTASGLALAQEHGAWRLERLVPKHDEAWPPGAPPPVVAEAATQAELGHDLPAPLAPAVAFTGRQHSLALTGEQGTVAVTVIRGTIRAVTEEHAVARLHLSGDERAVLAVALALAEDRRIEVARATLAGEALAAARASLPPTRRHGAPALPELSQAADAFTCTLAHLTDVVLHFAPAAAADVSGPEPVHQMRVALRRLRSAVTVFRPLIDCPELQAAAGGLKALTLRLGPTRDWDVFIGETLPAVRAAFPEQPRLARLATAAARRRRECHAALRDFLEGTEFRRLGIELAWLAGARCWQPVPPVGPEQEAPLQAFAGEVLTRRLRKLQHAEDLGDLAAPALHALRLQAKRARYAAEMFAPLYPGKAPRRFIERLAKVQDGLGVLNDRTTAEKLLGELGGPSGRHGFAVGLVLGFAAAHSADLLPRVGKRWDRLRRTGKFWA